MSDTLDSRDRLARNTTPAKAIRLQLIVLHGLAAIVLLFTLARYAGSPFRFDEVEFAQQANAILERGIPKVPNAQGRILYSGDNYYGYPPDARYGMWHPPMYLYSLALGSVIGGNSEAAKRLVGFAWFVGSLLVAMAIAGQIADGGTTRLERGQVASLAVLTPLLLEGSLFLDIDNTSLAFSLLLFIHVFLRDPTNGSVARSATLGLLLALALWSKLTTPFILVGSVGLFHLLNRRWRLAFIQTPLVLVVGCAVFALAYWSYCLAFDYPPGFMFEISYLGKADMYAARSRLIPALQALRWNLVWMSPGITLLLLVTVVRRVRRYLTLKNAEAIDLLVVFGGLSIAAYAVWAGMIGKYTFPGVLALLIASAELARRDMRTLELSRVRLLVVAVLLLAVFHALAVEPLQVKPRLTNVPVAGMFDAVRDPRNLYLVVSLASFGAFALLVRPLVRGKLVSRLTLLLVCYVVSANPINAAKVVLSRDDRSPYRPLEERGFESLVQALNVRFTPADTVFVPKDVGYYFHGPHYRLEDIWMWQGRDVVLKLLQSGTIAAFVDSRAFPRLAPEARTAAGLAPVEVHGDWVIYRPAATAERHAMRGVTADRTGAAPR